MFDKYFSLPAAIARHRSAPLVEERERFLAQLEDWGIGRRNVRMAACYLIPIIEVLRLHRLRGVTPEEVEQAASRWSKLPHKLGPSGSGEYGRINFARIARRFLRFLGRLKPSAIPQPFSKYLDDFVQAMVTEHGLAEPTIRARRSKAIEFLKWYAGRQRRFREVRLADVQAYINRNPANSDLKTRYNETSLLKAFFRHAESRGWCRASTSRGIQLPRCPHEWSEPQGPEWKDVLRLLEATRSSKPTEIRARAVMLLCAMHGLRSSETVNLLLSDIDWAGSRVSILRAKRRQQLPLGKEVLAAIRTYLDHARPRCSCPHLFVTTTAPFRPVCSHTLSTIVRRRMRRLGIASRNFGPTCLRNARATHLLETGSLVSEVARFLGLRVAHNANHYARWSIRKLKEVAATDLVGAL